MKNRSLLFFLLIIILPPFAMAKEHHYLQNYSDTIITKGKIDTSTKIENKVIDEVIESKTPKKEKV